MQMQPQVTQKDAGYIVPPPKRLHPAKGKGIRCGTCHYFGAYKSKCYIVSGPISSQGCCNLWTMDGKIEFRFASGEDIEDVISPIR